ncbi:MAG TPA: META domain-containing protein [Burkholderiales bacterium]|nr:META domain-containing protein [Burkholderiales bacterium]
MLHRFAVLLIAAALSGALSACFGGGTRGPQMLVVQGALTYADATALPPETRAIVEMRDASAHDGKVLAEQRIDLQGRPPPIPFEFKVERGKLIDDKPYAVRAAFHLRGRPTWVSDAVTVTSQAGPVDVGVLTLKPYTALAFASELECGAEKVTIGMAGDVLRLTAGGQSFDMRPLAGASASGSKYEAVSDPATTLWSHGDEARVMLKGRELPPCTVAGRQPPFRATGNEPGWRLDIDATRMSLLAHNGKTRFVAPTPRAVESDGTRKYSGRHGGSDITVTISRHPCTDTMTGMPYPQSVVVVFDGETMNGCGGDPAVLLTGAEWEVTDVTGIRFADGARVTVGFGEDGKVAGTGPCNLYTAQYVLTGESLTIRKVSTTRMGCEAQTQKQEQAFLDALTKVQRFEIAADGALLLHTSDQRTITARRG